jgi:co-chaperonin GroES (HSP10)
MAKIKVRPLDDRVVIRPAASEEVTAGGIVLPDSATRYSRCCGKWPFIGKR